MPIKKAILSSKLYTKLVNSKIYNKMKNSKIYKKLTSFNPQIYLKTLILIIVPILIFLYAQMFCNGKLFFEPKRMLLNFLFIYFIIGFFYCICGKIKISLFLTSFIIFFVGIVNHFITTFRGTPLVPWDIFSLNVALTVLPTFKFTVTPKLIIGIILFILTFIILKKSQFDSFKNGKFKK